MSAALREALIDAARSMHRLGINQGTSGNLSIRDGKRILITPSGRDYATMHPEDIVSIDFEGRYEGAFKPSSEWHFHAAILATRSEFNAIVHTHSLMATALSVCRCAIPPFHYMVAVAGGRDIRCADYATFGTPELAANAVAALAGRHACLLANHGLIACGTSIAAALALAVEVETLAAQYSAALQIGTPILLSDDEMGVVLKKFSNYGQFQSISNSYKS